MLTILVGMEPRITFAAIALPAQRIVATPMSSIFQTNQPVQGIEGDALRVKSTDLKSPERQAASRTDARLGSKHRWADIKGWSRQPTVRDTVAHGVVR
jgi:hypothetical protein